MNEVKFHIGGKERSFKLGVGALGDLIDHYDTNMLGLGQKVVKNPFSVVPAILYYSHYHYCRGNAILVDFTIYNFQDWFGAMEDPLNDKNVSNLLSVFIETMQKFLPKSEEKKENAPSKDEKKS